MAVSTSSNLTREHFRSDLTDACKEICKKCQSNKCVVTKVNPKCGHVVILKCNEDFPELCLQKCWKKLRRCNHRCQKKCYEKCGCSNNYEKVYPICGHKVSIVCGKQVSGTCSETCNKMLPCGHKCQLKCHDNCDVTICSVEVVKQNPKCGHTLLKKCNDSDFSKPCMESCDNVLECGHKCLKKCHEECDVNSCAIEVSVDNPECGHPGVKLCGEDSFQPCMENCEKTLSCGHRCEKLCHENCDSDVYFEASTSNDHSIDQLCSKPCRRKLPCGHLCQKKCFEVCDPNFCSFEVKTMNNCGQHMCKKRCNDNEFPKCEILTGKPLKCEHFVKDKCFVVNSTDYKCKLTCQRTLSCGHRCRGHQCSEECPPCVETRVRPSCQHKCSCYEFEDECSEKKSILHDCGHWVTMSCSLAMKLTNYSKCKSCFEEARKNALPCEKVLDCGHQCAGTRGEECPECVVKVTRDDCKHDCFCWQSHSECIEDLVISFGCKHEQNIPCCHSKRLKDKDFCSSCISDARARHAVKLQQMLEVPSANQLIREPITEQNESTSVEFFRVYDRVMRYVKPEHATKVTRIYSIEKIVNPALELRMFENSRNMFNGSAIPELFFHGTTPASAEIIIQDGFRIGSKGMYGAGIYFATDTTKSVQYCRQKDQNGHYNLLLCEVLLGKTKIYNAPANNLNYDVVRNMGYDSVFAKRRTQSSGGVANDEYIIYRPEQAVVKYMVKFS